MVKTLLFSQFDYFKSYLMSWLWFLFIFAMKHVFLICLMVFWTCFTADIVGLSCTLIQEWFDHKAYFYPSFSSFDKNEKGLEAHFYYFLSFDNSKKGTLGVFFYLFSISDNVKRLSSTCIFELIKVNETTSTQYKFNPFPDWDSLSTKKENISRTWLRGFLRYHFTLFRTWATNLRKGTHGVFFLSSFSNSLNMKKDRVFTIVRLVKT